MNIRGTRRSRTRTYGNRGQDEAKAELALGNCSGVWRTDDSRHLSFEPP